jgi:hypothetical protein
MKSTSGLGLLLGLLLGGIASAGSKGVQASADDSSGIAYFAVGPDVAANLFESVQGTVQMQVTDRVQDLALPDGDDGRFHLSLSRGVNRYEVDLIQAGFKEGVGQPSTPVGGGVQIDRDVFGFTGQGPSLITEARAAIALWGTATVSLNGQAAPNPARIFVAALSKGVHADDDSFRMLNQARSGDTELVVIIDNLPPSIDPRGFLEFGFEDVNITVDGNPVRKQLAVDVMASDEDKATAANTGTGGSGFGGGVPTPYLGTLPGTSAPTSGTSASASASVASASTTTNFEVLGPASVTPGTPASPPVANGNSSTGAPAPLNASAATLAPASPSPANASGATSLVSTPSPSNASAATSLVTTPSPLNASPTAAAIAAPAHR